MPIDFDGWTHPDGAPFTLDVLGGALGFGPRSSTAGAPERVGFEAARARDSAIRRFMNSRP